MVTRNLGMLDRVQDEAVLQLHWIERIAGTPLEHVGARFRQNPEIRDTRAGVLLALNAHLAVGQRHLPQGD